MGNQASAPVAAAAPTAEGGCPVKHDNAPAAAAAPAAEGGCPVKHGNAPAPAPQAAEGGCPVKHEKPVAAQVLGGGCPVKHDKSGSDQEVYNVYGQRIDPTNMMPYNPNQDPNDEQRYPLPQERVQSTIPKGGTEGTWLYPSEQMFYNALKRKGKGDDVHEGDVPTIVAIHNNMNERAWAQVEQYEKVCHPESEPKLLKFCGRPDDLTPIAWAKNLLGQGKPFDRHDWTIQRSDNTQARYVIDYYFDDEKANEDEVPELHSSNKVKSISMYARPAVDSVGAFVDRLKFPVLTLLKDVREPDLAARAALVENPSQSTEELPPLTPAEVEATFAQVQGTCKNAFRAMKTCASEVECTMAATALQLCMGQIICPPEAARVNKAIDSGTEHDIEKAFETMNNSLERFQERSAEALRAQAQREAAAKKQ
jgi:cytochrome c heme-lyase